VWGFYLKSRDFSCTQSDSDSLDSDFFVTTPMVTGGDEVTILGMDIEPPSQQAMSVSTLTKEPNDREVNVTS